MATDPMIIPVSNREAFGLALFLLHAVRPEGRTEERAYNRLFDEMGLDQHREAASGQEAIGALLRVPADPSARRTISRASADFIILAWDKTKGKHGAIVSVCLPLIDRIEAESRG